MLHLSGLQFSPLPPLPHEEGAPPPPAKRARSPSPGEAARELDGRAMFASIEGNHAGALREFGGVAGWLRARKQVCKE